MKRHTKQARAPDDTTAVVPLSSYEALHQRYDALVREIVALKRDGFVVPPALGEPAKPLELPAAIEKAITDLGVDNPTVRHLRREAWAMKRAGMDDAAIAERITEGEPVSL